jgi:hypothetical protein
MPIGIGLGASSSRPGITVQVAFTTNPNTSGALSPTWVTLSGRVLNIQLDRSGRSDELGLYQAGTATLTLRNVDGAFNPTNTAGPYFGLLLPYRPIRIVATWAGVDYPLWQGYVERWPQAWSDPTLGFAQIQCVDALAILNRIILDSAYAAEVLSDSPTVYYPLSETQGTTAGNQSTQDFSPAQIVHTKSVNTATPGTYTFGQTLDVAGGASQTGLGFTGTNNNGGVGIEDGFVLTLPRVSLTWTAWSFDLWCQIPKTPAQHGVIFQAVDSQHFSPLTGPIGTDPPGKISLYQTGAVTSLRLVLPCRSSFRSAGWRSTPKRCRTVRCRTVPRSSARWVMWRSTKPPCPSVRSKGTMRQVWGSPGKFPGTGQTAFSATAVGFPGSNRSSRVAPQWDRRQGWPGRHCCPLCRTWQTPNSAL